MREPILHGCKPGSDCGGRFRCATCQRLVGYCLGAWDAHPYDCDACANRKVEERERNPHE